MPSQRLAFLLPCGLLNLNILVLVSVPVQSLELYHNLSCDSFGISNAVSCAWYPSNLLSLFGESLVNVIKEATQGGGASIPQKA